MDKLFLFVDDIAVFVCGLLVMVEKVVVFVLDVLNVFIDF